MADEVIQARIVFDTGGLGKAAGIAGGGGGGGLTGAAGMSKAGLAGAVATGMIGATAILSVVKGLFKRIVDSWPGLQASFDIMNKSLQLFLRPIAIIMDMFIRPLAIMLMRLAIRFFKWFQEQDMKAKIEGAVAGLTEGITPAAKDISATMDDWIMAIDAFDPGKFIDDIGGVFVKIVDELSKVPWVEKISLLLVVIGEKLFTALLDSLPYVVYGIVKFGEELFEGLLFLIKFIVDGLGNVFGIFWEFMGGLLKRVGEGLSNAFNAIVDAISGLASWVWDHLVAVWESIVQTISGLGKWLWDKITSFFTTVFDFIVTVGTWVFEQIKTAFQSIWDAIVNAATWVGEQIKDAFQKLLDKIPSVEKGVQNIKETAGGIGEAATGALNWIKKRTIGDAIITKSGQIVETNPADNLFASKGGMNGGATINISISALDASSIDQRTISKISDAVQQVLKRNLYGLSKESYGV